MFLRLEFFVSDCSCWTREDCASILRDHEEHVADEDLCETGHVQALRQAIRSSTEK